MEDEKIPEINKINNILISSKIGKTKIKEIDELLSIIKKRFYDLEKENIDLKTNRKNIKNKDNNDLDKIKNEITKIYLSFCEKKNGKNYKKYPCKYYLEGKCFKEDKCNFLHETNNSLAEVAADETL